MEKIRTNVAGSVRQIYRPIDAQNNRQIYRGKPWARGSASSAPDDVAGNGMKEDGNGRQIAGNAGGSIRPGMATMGGYDHARVGWG